MISKIRNMLTPEFWVKWENWIVVAAFVLAIACLWGGAIPGVIMGIAIYYKDKFKWCLKEKEEVTKE